MLEKTLESPLDCWEIQPVNPKGNQSWIFIGYNDWCWSRNANILSTWCQEWTHLKRPWCLERLKMGGEVDDRGWDGWMASPTQLTWVWVGSGSWWWIAKPGVPQSLRSQRVRQHWATEVNWKNIWNQETIIVSKYIFTLANSEEENCQTVQSYVGRSNFKFQFNFDL